jgi:hypothetical protein
MTNVQTTQEQTVQTMATHTHTDDQKYCTECGVSLKMRRLNIAAPLSISDKLNEFIATLKGPYKYNHETDLLKFIITNKLTFDECEYVLYDNKFTTFDKLPIPITKTDLTEIVNGLYILSNTAELSMKTILRFKERFSLTNDDMSGLTISDYNLLAENMKCIKNILTNSKYTTVLTKMKTYFENPVINPETIQLKQFYLYVLQGVIKYNEITNMIKLIAMNGNNSPIEFDEKFILNFKCYIHGEDTLIFPINMLKNNKIMCLKSSYSDSKCHYWLSTFSEQDDITFMKSHNNNPYTTSNEKLVRDWFDKQNFNPRNKELEEQFIKYLNDTC